MAAPAGGAGFTSPAKYWSTRKIAGSTLKPTLINAATAARSVTETPVASATTTFSLPNIIKLPFDRLATAIKNGKAVGGSTGARKITVNSKNYIFKAGKPENVINEFAAFLLYKVAGARVPNVYLITTTLSDGDELPVGVLIDYIEGKTVAEIIQDRLLRGGKRIEMMDSLRDQFIYHALFSNWDAKNSLNHMIQMLPDGTMLHTQPYTIDLGGALFYRAMGEPKKDTQFLGLSIPELIDIPAESARSTFKIFVELTDSESLHGAVCRAWRRVDITTGLRIIQPEKIIAMAEQLSSQMAPFIPRAIELPEIITNRLMLLQDYCRDGTLIETIPATASNLERGADLRFIPRRVVGLAEKYRKTIKKGLETEAARPLRLHGKRSLASPVRINNAMVENVLFPTANKITSSNSSIENDYENNIMESSDKNSEPLLPTPPIITSLTRKNPRLQQTLLAMRGDPLITKWLEEQIKFIDESLSSREHDVLVAYTRYGDRLVNNYCRGTLHEHIDELLMEMLLGGNVDENINDTSKMTVEQKLNRFWNPDSDIQEEPTALAFGIVDQLSSLARVKDLFLSPEWLVSNGVSVPSDWKPTSGGLKYPNGSYVKKEDFLLKDGSINMRLVRLLLKNNFKYFSYTPHILTFLEQYKQELDSVLARAPKAPINFTVFRGIQSESHLTDLTFKTADFLSTSISPHSVINSFTRTMKGTILDRKYHCCVYELTVRRDVPCIYLESLTRFSGEYEILIAPDMLVSLGKKIHLKLHLSSSHSITTKEELISAISRPGKEYATVVEGVVRPPPIVSAAKPTPVFERGSLEDNIFIKKVKDKARESEKYSEAKPRRLRLSKKLLRKKIPSWKLKRRTVKKSSNRGK